MIVNYAHDQRQAESTVETILAGGGAAEAVRADVTDELDVERLFFETIETCGSVDAVVQAVIGSRPPACALAEVELEGSRPFVGATLWQPSSSIGRRLATCVTTVPS